MGEFIWYFIMATVVGTAFLPLVLREKCPTCRKRSLKQLSANEVFDLNRPMDEPRFVTYFNCENCEHLVRKVRSGPPEVFEDDSCQQGESNSLATAASAKAAPEASSESTPAKASV